MVTSICSDQVRIPNAIVTVGLPARGKTYVSKKLPSGQFTEDMIPTVGSNMRKITKGTIKSYIPHDSELWKCENGKVVMRILRNTK
ncbi:hypothetical protein OESDEN_06124 [Oesophagostomum dentatum]|uniref:Uncharacterized protein n=1 Tax=Oesophagostomum dentatum TaxID=61180 RepID=A0A0B1T9N3_OESDE|nr:hypothetical protein OESDEN_06124 [Oesophagostomum dentatum]